MPRGRPRKVVEQKEVGENIKSVYAYSIIPRKGGLYAVKTYEIQGNKVVSEKLGIEGQAGSVDNPRALLVGYIGIALMREDR